MNKVRLLLTSALLLTSLSNFARAEDETILTATVPFAFTVENTNLPAGTYRVSVVLPYETLRLERADGQASALAFFVPTSKPHGSETGKLVFDHIGDHYFLSQVWEQGNDLRRDLRTGSLAREMAKAKESHQSTTVFASPGSR